MSRIFAIALIVAVIIAVTVIDAYTSHEHYHSVITPAAQKYDGPDHILDYSLLDQLNSFAPGAKEVCAAGGEFRRKEKCISVKHTKKDVCCWHTDDDLSGVLPHACCGVGWKEHNCEKIISQLCRLHDPGVKQAMKKAAEDAAAKYASKRSEDL